jgi:hypothetical protein
MSVLGYNAWFTILGTIVTIVSLTSAVVNAALQQQAVFQDKPVTRLNYGVFFRPIKPVKLITSEWVHRFVIQLPRIYGLIHVGGTLGSTIQYMQECHDASDKGLCVELVPMLVHVKTMHEKTVDRYNQIMTNIHKMIPSSELLSRSRKRHRWLPFLGNILHTVTGVATQSDLDRLQRVVKKIADSRYKQF